MAVKDYNVDPDLNTTIKGINIAEGCPPSGINNAIRQLMADVKAESNSQDAAIATTQTKADAALPKAGGTMTGNLDFSGSHHISLTNNDGYLRIWGGNRSSGSGANLLLFGKDHAGWGGGAGSATLYVGNDDTDGLLTWRFQPDGDLVTPKGVALAVDSYSDNHIRFSNGLQICFMNILPNSSGYFNVTWPVPFYDANRINVVYSALAGETGKALFSARTYSLTTTKVTGYATYAIDSATGFTGYFFSCIAFGRWK